MKDMISRQKALNALEKLQKYEPEGEPWKMIRWIEAHEAIEDLEEIGWISCREHLPEIRDNGVSDMVLLCWSDGQRTVGAYIGNDTFVGQAWPKATGANVTVVAWMPIPMPYKEQEPEG